MQEFVFILPYLQYRSIIKDKTLSSCFFSSKIQNFFFNINENIGI